MLNISWGTKIATLYIAFVALIITMVLISFNQKIDLVSDDYYDQEIAFQSKLDEMNNANLLNEKITHEISSNQLLLKFPAFFINKSVKGNILFFRPSDSKKDFKTKIQLNENGKQFINTTNLSKGMFKMQIDWVAEGKSYFSEEVVVIP